jgi:23S rRNA (uridine2552-2'-O)-methyltransferase
VSSEWLRKRKRDQFRRFAKARGYRSRAIYKLFQIDEQYHFIRRGERVLDLGAAPGGWLQAVHKLVGRPGYVFGVDKQPIAPLKFENVVTLEADVSEEGLAGKIESKANGIFDVIVSDLAPDVSGVWEVDQARQIELARCALRLAGSLLVKSGNMLVKVFQGSDLREFRDEMKSSFRIFRIVKPQASRPESAELYFLGLDYLGPPPEPSVDTPQ